MADHPSNCLCKKCLGILEDSSEREPNPLARSLGTALGNVIGVLSRRWLTRNEKIAPLDAARILHEVFVQEKHDDEASGQFEIPEDLVSQFRAKVTLYREALILMILISESQAKGIYRQTLCAYEELVLGPSPTTPGLEKLVALKAAMADLENLISPKGEAKEFTWSREWLSDIECPAHNPAGTLMFALFWTGQYRAIVAGIRKLKL
jgi:hypothetical protein